MKSCLPQLRKTGRALPTSTEMRLSRAYGTDASMMVLEAPGTDSSHESACSGGWVAVAVNLNGVLWGKHDPYLYRHHHRLGWPFHSPAPTLV